jgi:hypothetical protein
VGHICGRAQRLPFVVAAVMAALNLLLLGTTMRETLPPGRNLKSTGLTHNFPVDPAV